MHVSRKLNLQVCRSVSSSFGMRPDLKSEKGASGQQNRLAIRQSPYYGKVNVYTISTKKQVSTIRRTQPFLVLWRFGAQRTFLQRKHKMPSRDCTWNYVMHGTSSTLKWLSRYTKKHGDWFENLKTVLALNHRISKNCEFGRFTPCAVLFPGDSKHWALNIQHSAPRKQKGAKRTSFWRVNNNGPVFKCSRHWSSSGDQRRAVPKRKGDITFRSTITVTGEQSVSSEVEQYQ